MSCIARELHMDLHEVKRAAAHIRRLNPRPANGFWCEEVTAYIIPDMIVDVSSESTFCLSPTQTSPLLRLSDYYLRLSRETEDVDAKRYLEKKITQANWIIQGIQSRENTLRLCVDTILQLQPEFFRGGRLYPMSLSNVAEHMNVHPSTVSRAVRGKYIQTNQQLIPIQQLFSRAVTKGTDGEITAETIKAQLRCILDSEAPYAPLSDQALCNILASRGYRIARRTVAKYRQAMGYPPATARELNRTSKNGQ